MTYGMNNNTNMGYQGFNALSDYNSRASNAGKGGGGVNMNDIAQIAAMFMG